MQTYNRLQAEGGTIDATQVIIDNKQSVILNKKKTSLWLLAHSTYSMIIMHVSSVIRWYGTPTCFDLLFIRINYKIKCNF